MRVGRWMVGAAVVVVAILGIMMFRGGDGGSNGDVGPTVVMPTASGTPRSSLPVVDFADLPFEAQQTIELIEAGGPYPHREDGSTFRNFEHRLPNQPRGYYREFTVDTPDVPGRGPRRVVQGQAGDLYYTNDHYETFRQVVR